MFNSMVANQPRSPMADSHCLEIFAADARLLIKTCRAGLDVRGSIARWFPRAVLQRPLRHILDIQHERLQQQLKPKDQR